MRVDNLGLILTNEPEPGCFGDSCAETARMAILSLVLKTEGLKDYCALGHFITDKGVLRHPDSPWREDDTSQDQKLPLFLALNVLKGPLLDEYKKVDLNWKLKTYIGLKVFIQALIFKIPFRWDDGSMSFQWSSKSSCDYLNFTAQIFYAHLKDEKNLLIRLAMRIIPSGTIKVKILQYYMNDPTNAPLIHDYFTAIETVWA